MNRAQATPESLVAASKRMAGLYAVTPNEPDTRILADKVRRALAGGARVVQFRNKLASQALRRGQAVALFALCREAGVPFIINDDLDLALALDADGVHLGRDDLDIARARETLGPGKILGASCYDSIELALTACEQGADYVAFGSVFPSATKSGAAHAPLSLFREAQARIDLPIIAIGGITPENARSVIDVGADAVAVISALFQVADIEAAARGFDRLFEKKNP